IRTAYVQHIAAMLALIGVADGPDAAGRIMALETRLASHHWDTVASRDAVATHNPVDRAGLDALTPGFDWNAWCRGLDVEPTLVDAVIVREPDYFRGFAEVLAEVDLEDWKLWAIFHLVSGAAPLLSQRFVETNFAFQG